MIDYMVIGMGIDITAHGVCDLVKDGGMEISSRARISSTQCNASTCGEDKRSA